MKIKSLAIIAVLIFTASCKNNENLFEMKVIDKDDKKVVQFIPNMSFEVIKDSAYFYFSKKDYQNVLGASISKGEQIYKSDKFEVRVILRTYAGAKGNKYEFVLRTFSKDFKIIDSYVMASTINDKICTGIVDANLSITTTCDDGTITIATVDDYGKFVINE